MLFHIISKESGDFLLSPVAEGDKIVDGSERLSPGVPLFLGQKLVTTPKTDPSRDGKKAILKILRKYPGLQGMDWHWERINTQSNNSFPGNVCVPEFAKILNIKDRDFTARLQDRQLSEGDLQRFATEIGLSLEEVVKCCDERVRQGSAEWLPAVQKEEGQGWRCLRCGETEIEEWPSIYGIAGTCPSCSALGSLSSLQALYRSIDLSPPDRNNDKSFDVTFSPHWVLSQAQEWASREVLEYVSSGTKLPLLLWAACGAGKTEVCFPAASWALQRGKKVLFAAPRQDVVLDVAPRLERDFPGLKVSVLTGLSQERFSSAPIVLATTHQILRFYQAFDLIFMDEVDAFPYYGNKALAWGVQQSLKPGGKIIYLTATPSPENRAKVQRGEMKLARLPARHHRKALPVPEWVKYAEGNSTELANLICPLAEDGTVLLFVPKISWVSRFVEKLRTLFPRWAIEGSYSSDPGRRDKVEKLRQGGYSIFVSTSILERGVTVAKAQVIVMEADHEIFDERGLVQMAGRVGRTRENPKGRALFLSKRKTPAIEKAIDWIKEQNRIAREEGLID